MQIWGAPLLRWTPKRLRPDVLGLMEKRVWPVFLEWEAPDLPWGVVLQAAVPMAMEDHFLIGS
jgi:hypothetical protein